VIVSIHLPDWIIQELEKRGIKNRSALIQKLLVDYLGGIHYSHYRIEELRRELNQIDAQVTALKCQIDNLTKLRSQLAQELKEQLETRDRMERSRLAAEAISKINQLLESVGYDVEAAWPLCQPLCEKLTELGYPADKDWLTQQAKRLRIWS